MINEDFEIVRLNEGVLGRVAEEIIGMAHDELVEWSGRSDEHGARAAAATASAAGALPGSGDRARVAGHHYGVQRADVDAQFERAGGNDSADAGVAETAFDFAALVRKVAAA